ncbi:MAG: histidine kinase [Hungatella sp.]|nr:histidine kinase [Hungatella sp.]
MRTFINNLKFRSKIICFFGIMFFFSMAVSSVLYYNFAARDVEENFKVGAEDVMTQMADALDLRLATIRQRAQGMLSNFSFMTGLSDYLNNPTDFNTVKAMGDMASYLTDLETGETLIHSTYIYTDKQQFETYMRMRNHSFSFPQSEYYRDYMENPGNAIRWFPVTEDRIFQDREQVIPMIWQFSLQTYQGGQYLVIQIRQNELERILNEKYEFFDKIIILDKEGGLIAGPAALDIEKLTALEEDGYLVVHEQLKENGWQIFGLKSRQALLGNLRQLRIMILEIMVAVFVLSVSAGLFLSHQMTESLRRLERQMSYVQKGDLNVRFFYPYRDEVGSLAKSFNYMIGEIQDLVKKQEETIEELKEERNHVAMVQKQKREAELKALQAQINPHFLYNTLNAITWQAADQGAEEISILSSSLGRFFRVSLSKGAEIISLREELDHVTSYLEIQSIRYHSRLNYEIRVEEPWKVCRVIKLCLQPLAENSIYHGIKEKENSGLIRIWAEEGWQEETPVLCLVVWDDGAGIPKEKLDIINENLKMGRIDHGEGYGIYNVNERLRLFYGESYGLRYESEEGKWTKGILTLPISK